jgi:hypothetical protein
MEITLYILGTILLYLLIGVGYSLLVLSISGKLPKTFCEDWVLCPESKKEFLHFVFSWPFVVLFQTFGPPCYVVILLILNFQKIFDKLLGWSKAYKKLK